MKMRKFRLLVSILVTFMTCGMSAYCETPERQAVQSSETYKTVRETPEIAELINSAYNQFVFALDSSEEASPEMYFSAHALMKLQQDYTFDCDKGPCYAFYALRTEYQDSKPGSDETSRILEIEPAGDGWYTVSYCDMGWPGKTRIRIVDGKIDDYRRIEF